MVPAKHFGVKVTQYFVGFGKTVWSTAEGRHRVRRQGHPDGRLHPDDRACCRPPSATTEGRIKGIQNGFFGGMIADARAHEVEQSKDSDAGPAVLPQAVVAEGHHHGRWPDDEHLLGGHFCSAS